MLQKIYFKGTAKKISRAIEIQPVISTGYTNYIRVEVIYRKERIMRIKKSGKYKLLKKIHDSRKIIAQRTPGIKNA